MNTHPQPITRLTLCGDDVTGQPLAVALVLVAMTPYLPDRWFHVGRIVPRPRPYRASRRAA